MDDEVILNKEEVTRNLRLIRQSEKDKNKLEESYLFQSILFVLIGLLMSFVTQSRLNVTTMFFEGALSQTADKPRLLIYSFIYFCLFLFSTIRNKFKFGTITYKIIPIIIIGLLYAINSFIYGFGYKYNFNQYPFIEYLWGILFTTLFYYFNPKSNFKNVSKLTTISFIVVVTGAFLSLISDYKDKESSLVFVFHNREARDNLLCILNGIIFSANIIMQDYYLTTNEEIYYGLPFIGLTAFVVSIIIGGIEGDFSRIKNLRFANFANGLMYFGILLIGLVTIIFIPFYVKKCTSFAYLICTSMELLISRLTGLMFKGTSEDLEHEIQFSAGHIAATLLYLGGFLLFLYEKFRKEKNVLVTEDDEDKSDEQEVPLTNQDYNKLYPLVEERI